MIKTPITITEKNGDKTVFDDLTIAESSVEATDVIANEYVAHDALGRELKFSVQKQLRTTFFGMIKNEVDVVKITERALGSDHI